VEIPTGFCVGTEWVWGLKSNPTAALVPELMEEHFNVKFVDRSLRYRIRNSRQTNEGKNLTPTTAVGTGNYRPPK